MDGGLSYFPLVWLWKAAALHSCPGCACQLLLSGGLVDIEHGSALLGVYCEYCLYSPGNLRGIHPIDGMEGDGT